MNIRRTPFLRMSPAGCHHRWIGLFWLMAVTCNSLEDNCMEVKLYTRSYLLLEDYLGCFVLILFDERINTSN